MKNFKNTHGTYIVVYKYLSWYLTDETNFISSVQEMHRDPQSNKHQFQYSSRFSHSSYPVLSLNLKFPFIFPFQQGLHNGESGFPDESPSEQEAGTR